MDNIKNTDSLITGLTQIEVDKKIALGLVNKSHSGTDRTVTEIVLSNVCTYFNLIFLIISILLIVVCSFRNLTFLPVIIGNTVIGIVQELRAKNTLEKMRLLNTPHTTVIRESKLQNILSEELVQGDIIFLTAGKQICADAVIVKGSIQVNESLLTGEADEIEKNIGSNLLSGSFVVSGECYARLERVGDEAYISKLGMEAKAMNKKEQSEMIRHINLIVKMIGIVIIPIAMILFLQSYYINEHTLKKSVTSTVAAVIGMIPEGLYLLTTLALAISMVKLAGKNILLHDMKSIETLARVDVLCVDKTGTITEPDMEVEDVFVCKENSLGLRDKEFKRLLYRYALFSMDNNSTMNALKKYAKLNSTEKDFDTPINILPFSSELKYGSIKFNDGIYLLGAPEFIIKDNFSDYENEIIRRTKSGKRVLLFAKYPGDNIKDGLIEDTIALGFVSFKNPIRKSAVETFNYFKKQGVNIKIISGDNPKTVSEIGVRAGIENAEKYIDASLLESDEKIREAALSYTVFGRVTPKQKQKIIRALQDEGHTVAMTGDGVNDILAMKDADCSIAMASGSEAATQAAQVVLLDSDFSHMPELVYEGRRVVNNIERSASLFLVKNIFSLLLSLLSAVFMFTYPLEPAQISIVGMFTIGIPGFLLALEPGKERIRGHFLKNVLLKALPGGLTDVIIVFAIVVCGSVFSISKESISTIATMVMSVVGFMILCKISIPLDLRKCSIIFLNIAGLIFTGIFLGKFFALTDLSGMSVLFMVIFGFVAESLFRNLTVLVEKTKNLYNKIKTKLEIKKK